MKKKISLALSVGVLLTTLSPVQTLAKSSNTAIISSSSIDVDKYIPKIKAIFQISDDYDNFRTNKYRDEDIIELSWYITDKGEISVSIDSEGNIVRYYNWKNDMNREEKVYKFPKISKEEGEKIARDFIRKISPEIADKIELKDDYERYGIYNEHSLEGYTYIFTETENNVPISDKSINVTVDGQNGEVISYYPYGQKNLKLPNKEGIISEDEAKELYREKVGLELMYKLRGVDNNFERYLGYTITNTDKTIDAKTKDIVSTSENYMYPIYRQYLYEKGVENVSSAEENTLINSKAIISRNDASKKILDTFKLGEGYEVSTSHIEKIKEEDNYIWVVSIMRYEKDGSSSADAAVNAKTGEIIGFSDPRSWDEDDNEKVKYSKEELLKKAKEFIQKNNPEKYKETEYVEISGIDQYGYSNEYQFQFIRKSNDIKVENSGFRVVISGVTGNVVDYSYSWDDSELPLAEDIIGEDKAKEVIFDGKELELEYQGENEDKENIKLVYDFKDKHLVVDAKTGEIVDNKKELERKYGKKTYKDIENSFAKNQIEKLQENITLFEGEDFKPKSEITQKDFFKLLIQTKRMFYGWDDEDYLYEVLVRQNIVKNEEKNPDGKVTREEAMKYIVRAFGQEQSGNLGEIYRIDYNDADQIDSSLRGHVAIAKGLGIISGEGNFRPKDNLRRDEAAVLIYNILNRSN
ncbi:S-layer-like domain-containing protein [Gottschalkia acidurici 9a]|uniref:S-layer-like domain-containing protein n=1 Tax=Gottschalkia acidurici (strain ATCC 7906 / DSM 604 / BCRC 14475 / CIP 104303 / KCTC 5404 / NCIMB 10678 / 9a) TaxID=1128398 RepID=K0AY15_GOTA9|nr:YcdB/YcdC domain-containing protein [Gottschalkia acidurici]AFS77645.1 S-layer-like domain-containing protein [Gottschalkia acidurici 9a]